MTPEYRRLLLACRSELEADLANEAWGPEQYARHHARMWDLYHPGAAIYEVGREVVCRHVAEEVALEAEQRGCSAVIDLWELERDGSPYTRHATITVRIAGEAYYIESARHSGEARHRGHFRRVRTGSDPMHTTGMLGAVDVQWYRNIIGGRALARWVGVAGNDLRSEWRRQLLGHRLRQIEEVRTGEAEDLTNGGPYDRKVPV